MQRVHLSVSIIGKLISSVRMKTIMEIIPTRIEAILVILILRMSDSSSSVYSSLSDFFLIGEMFTDYFVAKKCHPKDWKHYRENEDGE